MSPTIAARARTHRLGSWPAMTGLVLAAVAVGAAYPLTALRISPWALPGIVFLAAATMATYRRPELGIAAALVIIPADTLGFPHKFSVGFIEGWAVYVAGVAYLKYRATGDAQPWPAIGTAIVAFLAVTILSAVNAPDLHAALHEIAQLSAGTLLFIASTYCIQGRRELAWLLGGITVGAAAVALHAIGQFATGGSASIGFVTSNGAVVGRVAAGFDSPNHLAGFLLICVPLAIGGAAMVRHGRSLFVAVAFAAAVGVYASVSRGALIGLVLVPFVFLRGWRLWLIGPALLAVGVLAAPGLVKERFATLSSSNAEIQTRADIWRTALTIWEAHPVLGVGVAGFPSAYSNAPIPGKLFSPNSVFKPPPHAHNMALELLAEEGIPGLVTFLFVLGVAFRDALRLRAGPRHAERVLGSALVATLVAFLVHNLFDVTLVDQHTSWYLFVALGVLAGAQRRGLSSDGGGGPAESAVGS